MTTLYSAVRRRIPLVMTASVLIWRKPICLADLSCPGLYYSRPSISFTCSKKIAKHVGKKVRR